MNNQSGKSLVLVDKVLNSLRDSAFDIESAFGEVIDNSIQAGSKHIHIFLKEEEKFIGSNKNPSKVCTEVVFGDDGQGMNAAILHSCLQLGSSTRYNDRHGIGRFGVGATLGGISQCKKIRIYSRTASDQPWLTTYIDLDEIESGAMVYIPEPKTSDLPQNYKNLVGHDLGTLIIWQKCDRIEANIANGNARVADTLLGNLSTYISRTYRKFIGGGTKITLNNTPLTAYDPLYAMYDPRYPNDERAVLDDPIEIPWEIPNKPGQTSTIIIRMSLLPISLRPEKSMGGRPDRRIPRENRGLSILRANREIAYGVFSDMQPSVKDNEIDRYWGCEICFEPELDECWSVRNIKKGAEPVDELKRAIREKIEPVIRTYRKEIREFWRKEEQQKTEDNPHQEVEKIAANSNLISFNEEEGLTCDQTQELLNLLEQIHAGPKREEQIKEKVISQPFSIEDSSWPGQEFIEIKYLSNRVVIVFNRSHPFFDKFYNKLEDVIFDENNISNPVEIVRTAVRLLLVAFANAQRAQGEEIFYDNLRTQWGMSLRQLVNEWMAEN